MTILITNDHIVFYRRYCLLCSMDLNLSTILLLCQAHVKGVGSVESMISLRDQMRNSNFEIASNNLAMVRVSSRGLYNT